MGSGRTLIAAIAAAGLWAAQAPPTNTGNSNRCAAPTAMRPASYKSAEQLPDGRITFRLCAPDATTVSVGSSDNEDISPNTFMGGTGRPMAKDEKGLWSVTTPKPIAPAALSELGIRVVTPPGGAGSG